MAKWLTLRIVAPAFVGSIPIIRLTDRDACLASLFLLIKGSDHLNQKLKGVLLAMLGALCWGIQGPISQFLFQETVVSTEWLMGIKMLVAGIILSIYAISREGLHKFMAPWHHVKEGSKLLAYALFGITLVQYMYFLTIKVSDAGIATILQSLGTIIIIILTLIIYHKLPTKAESFSVVLALVGTWFLVTSPSSLLKLNLSTKTIIFGLLLAFAGAMQTMIPVGLLKKYSSFILLGHAMLIGGIIFTCIHPFWRDYPKLTMPVLLGVSFIVLFGTALAYICFTSSLKYISATSAGLLAAVEPVSAVIGTVCFLGTTFTWNQLLGGVLVVSTIFILALFNKKEG